MVRRTSILLGMLGMLGCRMPNPAFDDGGDAHQAEAEADVGSEVGSETADSAESSTSDGTETSDTGPVETCELTTRPGLRLALRTPEVDCLADQKLSLLLDSATFNGTPGMASGSMCEVSGCGSCETPGYAVGAPNFMGLADVWTSLGSVITREGIEQLCVEVEATGLVGLVEGDCIYRSIAIVDDTIEHGPVFIGHNAGVPLTGIGSQIVANQPPTLGEPTGVCDCAGVHSEVVQRDCCESSGVDPTFYSLLFQAAEVEPGGSQTVLLGSVPWRFHAVQAQAIPRCQNPQGSPAVSWALARDK